MIAKSKCHRWVALLCLFFCLMASAQRHGNDDFPEYDTSDTEASTSAAPQSGLTLPPSIAPVTDSTPFPTINPSQSPTVAAGPTETPSFEPSTSTPTAAPVSVSPTNIPTAAPVSVSPTSLPSSNPSTSSPSETLVSTATESPTTAAIATTEEGDADSVQEEEPRREVISNRGLGRGAIVGIAVGATLVCFLVTMAGCRRAQNNDPSSLFEGTSFV